LYLEDFYPAGSPAPHTPCGLDPLLGIWGPAVPRGGLPGPGSRRGPGGAPGGPWATPPGEGSPATPRREPRGGVAHPRAAQALGEPP